VNIDKLVINGGDESEQTAVRLRVEMLSSFMFLVRTMYEINTGREFVLSHPVSNESHFITIARVLTKVFWGDMRNVLINCPPGWGKSALLTHFVAWALGHYPDSRFMYISYSHELAAKHVSTIKSIVSLPHYRKIFGVSVRKDSDAKDDFSTTAGGGVKAFGSAGSITGFDAGLPHLKRFSGAVIMDDMHKPDEVFSETMRERVIENYRQTIRMRRRGPNVPLIFIGQRLHEADLGAYLLDGKDGEEWEKVVIKAHDEHNNALYPEKDSMAFLENERRVREYVYWSQYMQTPQPAGGGIFKEKDFIELEHEPNILATFVTVDSAETDKTWNDATVFSFWGVYKVEFAGVESDTYALHWLNCWELRVEPKELENEFLTFWGHCMRHPQKPQFAAIERKSTGVTLCSVLSSIPGLRVLEVERNSSSGNKIQRFLNIQPFIARHQVTFPKDSHHFETCVAQLTKITKNNSHKNDDIADTMFDAVKCALIDKMIIMHVDDRKETHREVPLIQNSRAFREYKANVFRRKI